MAETVFETTSGSNDAILDIVYQLSQELNCLSNSHSDVDLEGVSARVTQLLETFEALNETLENAESAMESAKCEVHHLSRELDREKRLRRDELNNSLKVQDVFDEEKQSFEIKLKELTSAIRGRDSQIAALEDEKTSLARRIKVLDEAVTRLEDRNDQLSSKLTAVSDQLRANRRALAERNNSVYDKWIDDDIINSYFYEMSNCGSKDDILFLGPAQTQSIKLGSVESVIEVLAATTYYSCKYVFFCVNNSNVADKWGTGSHWSFLFVDKDKSEAYHFDSLSGMNRAAALRVAANLNIPGTSIFEMSCQQQKNGFECGINVILNAKFVLNFYCLRSCKTPFRDWYQTYCMKDIHNKDPAVSQNIDKTESYSAECTEPITIRKTHNGWSIVPGRPKSNNCITQGVSFIPVNRNMFEVLTVPDYEREKHLSDVCSSVKQLTGKCKINKPRVRSKRQNPDKQLKSEIRCNNLRKPVFDCKTRASSAGSAASTRPCVVTESCSKSRIRCFTDSHGRRMSSLLLSKVDSDFNVVGHVIPNGRMCHVLDAAGRALNDACQGDFIVLMAGTNDIGEYCNVEHFVQQVERVLEKPTKAKLLVLGIPLRYDTDLFNSDIIVANRRLGDICVKYKNCTFMSLNRLSRRHYTAHGLHFRINGKRMIVNMIHNIIYGHTKSTYHRIDNVNRGFVNESTPKQRGPINNNNCNNNNREMYNQETKVWYNSQYQFAEGPRLNGVPPHPSHTINHVMNTGPFVRGGVRSQKSHEASFFCPAHIPNQRF